MFGRPVRVVNGGFGPSQKGTKMKLVIADSVASAFPGLTVGVFCGQIADARPDVAEVTEALRAEAVEKLRGSGLSTEQLTSHPNIGAWRAAYQAFGVKAKTHKPTHEALARRLLREEGWPDINPIVNVYLANQVAHLLPHGGYDLSRVVEPITLTVSAGDEEFVALGGADERTAPGEVVYRDGARILTRRWNYKDCDHAKITLETRSFVLMAEAPSDAIPVAAVEDAMEGLVCRYDRCFVGTFAYQIVRPNAMACEVELPFRDAV